MLLPLLVFVNNAARNMGVTLRGDLGSMGGRDREAKPGRTAAGRIFQWLERLHRAAPGVS